MTTKRSRKAATETAIVEAAEDEVQSTELEQTEPEVDVRETDQVEAPRLRKCPNHSTFFAGEDDMRPLEEFSFNKTTGKLMNTYCKRCNSKCAPSTVVASVRRPHSPSSGCRPL